MILVILEKTMDGICSAKNVLYEKYPMSARMYVTSRTDTAQLRRLETQPLLCPGWLIETDYDVGKDKLRKIGTLPDCNMVIINAANIKQFDKVKELLHQLNLSFKVVDNRVPPEGQIMGYISNELTIAEDAARYLIKKYHSYLPDIVAAVNTLKQFSFVDKQIAKRYSPEANPLALYELVGYLIGYNSRITYNEAVHIVYDYRYGSAHLLTYLSETLMQYVLVYEQIELGLLSAENVTEFKRGASINEIKDLNSYQILRMIDSYSSVSMEKLWYVYLKVKSIKKDRYSLYKLIYLLKLGK